MSLDKDTKIDVREILKDLENYRPRRKGWTWRKQVPNQEIHGLTYKQTSEGLKQSLPMPTAKHFGNIDPQPDCVITTEIASGRFEDDIRRMRMAAWHGADHMMVIRTAGQSHYDGLIEGTPEGVGGVPITRKQIRATRKALDLVEDEVGRPINFHSYVSGVAGPEIAVLFAEEGVNGAHQDPQYNVLYRNVNMLRSFVDAAVAKAIMASHGMAQIDGAHNANATAREGWKVMPELMVQHAINCAFSRQVGMPAESICLSTVPPNAAPIPALGFDLPYAVALRELFKDYKMRAQMNTKYIESDTREATVSHTLNLLISRLTSVDIQSTITPDEGRNVPWHYNNVSAVNTAKQALLAMDGLLELVEIKRDGILGERVRELKERSVLFMEEMLDTGGYFDAVEAGFFVDSGHYPERNGDGIARKRDTGVGADSIIHRESDYFAPVCHHFGYNNIPVKQQKACDMVDGCTMCYPERAIYVDELDENDNVNMRLAAALDANPEDHIKPEVEWAGDGIVNVQLFLPTEARTAHFAALEIVGQMGLTEPEVIHRQTMQEAEGTYLEVKGRFKGGIDPGKLKIPKQEEVLDADSIKQMVEEHPIKVVAATVGEDEHSVGMREIMDIKHGGLEGFGIESHYLGTSVPIEKVIDAAIELDARAILISTIITHADIHRINMRKLHDLCVEKGVRDQLILIGGGTQVTHEIAVDCGLDAGFGRGTKGIHVASFMLKNRKERGLK